MKIEQRNVYIAENGEEFDTEEMCKKFEATLKLEKLLDLKYLETNYDYAQYVIDNFQTIKELLEG